MATKITDELVIAIIKQCYEDLEELARLFTLYYYMPDVEMPNYVRICGHFVEYVNKRECLEKIHITLKEELKDMTIAIDLTDCIANSNYIWHKFLRKIKQSYPLFYRMYEPELERLLNYAQNKR